MVDAPGEPGQPSRRVPTGKNGIGRGANGDARVWFTLGRGILNEIAYEEQAHVRFLRSALGTAAVAMPDIDLSFFGPLAVAAGVTTVASG